MYGGSQKFGRGGGGGAGRGGGGGANKRNSFPPPPLPPQRLSSTTPSRLSLGGSASRGRNPPPSTASAPEVDETFNLISGGNPLSFAAIIRLAPDLVDEIKRVESQGGAAKIKFDPNPNNPLGNVIDVGGKEFRFTWSHEMGGLCDIYEERQSGEDGNGLLVESGCAWRKLNVQRVLDESTKNHLKMRSEEAERKSKSRKAIVLDQCNPSMKSQMKALAAAEASPWKFKHKKDVHFKKRNYESSQVGGPFKNAHKPGFSSSSSAKGRCSTSPLPSSPNQSVPLTSPSVRGNVSQAVAEDTTPIQARTKENTANSEKDINVRASGRTQEAAARRNNQGTGAVDMQNLLTTLLKENPKGMSIKALEKAVGDVAPNTARKIEPILKKIATYEPPGKYILKPRVELESSKRPDSGSSPLDHHQKQYVPKDGHGPAPDLVLTGKSPAENLEEQMPVSNNFELEEPNVVEKIDASQHFTELFGDDEPPENGEGQAASSSDSGSDSDSDSGSSDSGSDSGSQSRSRSPAGSASGSDSENDSSSNNKEASDVDIDIMNDDDKEPKSLQDAEQGLPIPASWSMPDFRPVPDGSLAGQDGYASEDIDIEKDDDNEAEIVTAPLDPVTPAEKLKTVSLDHDLSQAYGVVDVPNEQEVVEDEFKHGKPESTRKSKGKSKRSSNVLQSEENAEHVKRLKAGSMAQSLISGYMGSSPSRFSPDITNDNHHENHNLQMPNQVYKDDASTLGVQSGYNYPGPGKSAAELLQSGRRPARAHDIEPVDIFAKNPQSRGLDVKLQETNAHSREGLLKQGYKGWKETQDEEGSSNDKYNGKFKEGSLDRKQNVRTEPHYKIPSEEGKKSCAMENSSRLGSSPKDKPDFYRSPADRKKLQRELSDLELGELREPLPEEPEVTEKQFERLGSFKQLETKLDTSGSRNADLKDKTLSKPTVDPGNLSSPNSRAGFAKNSDIWPKRTAEPYAEESTQTSQRAVQPQQQHSMVARPEVGSLSHKAAGNDRLRHNEGVANQGFDAEGYGETQKKSHTSMQPEDSRQGLGSRKTKGSKSQRSNSAVDDSDKRRDVSLVEGRTVKRKRIESSSDKNSSYSKYEKEEPELKGPISSVSQYKEYVREYCEKYEVYLSLNNILENYRNEFHKLGIDLDSAKGRDMERYYKIVAQLRESYQKSGMRHKRLKKIFVVLHKELTHLKQRIKDFAAEYTRD